MIEQIVEINDLGWGTFPVNAKDKTPMVKDWKGREPDVFSVYAEEDIYVRGGAYGIVLRPCDLIVDIDPRSFKKGDENPWKRFKTDHNLTDIDLSCPVVNTGGGGHHLYFLKPPHISVVKKAKGYPGLEFSSGGIGKGAYVLGPQSGHPSGNKYILRENRPFSALHTAPERFLSLIERIAPNGAGESTEELTGGQQGYDRFVEWIQNYAIPTLIEEEEDPQRYRVACEGRQFGLKPEMTAAAMLGHYNLQCPHVWSVDKINDVVKHAYKYAIGAKGKHDPAAHFEEVKNDEPEEWDSEEDKERKWDLDNHSQPKKTLRNCVNYLYMWPELAGCIKHNKFTGDLEVSGRLPWHEKRGPTSNWTDTDVVLLKYYMSKKVKIEFSTDVLWGAIYTVGARFAYHPVRKWIRGLSWDGEERLSGWLSDYCGAGSNEYTHAVARKTLIGAVSRVFRPGSQFDYALVLEGAQGVGKTTICRILGGRWYGDIIIDPHGRDTVDAMRGKWVVELSEMEVTRRSDVQALKAFLSRNSDRTRLAYARSAQDFPRQCIFIGTINPDDMGYLNDTTGNRRFWPVRCGKTIDTEGLAEVRDQLFAEAYEAFRKGEKTYLTGNVEQLAKIEQAERQAIDPWEDAIVKWLDTEAKDVRETNINQIWEFALGAMAKSITRADQSRIGRILTRMGWRKTRPTRGGGRLNVYTRPVGEGEISAEELLLR